MGAQAMKPAKKTKPKSPWEIASRYVIERHYMITGKMEPLDRGVNFFVQAIERLGGETCASCEGHPRGFYVLFGAPYEVALAIKRCGYFNVEVEGNNAWSIRLTGNESTARWTDKQRRFCLAHASDEWVKKLPIQ